MNKIEQLQFIEGNFSDEEAKEILMTIFSAKISYHKMKNLSSQVGFNKDDEMAQKRIPLLQKATEKFLDIISEAKLNKKRLLITSDINISILED